MTSIRVTTDAGLFFKKFQKSYLNEYIFEQNFVIMQTYFLRLFLFQFLPSFYEFIEHRVAFKRAGF